MLFLTAFGNLIRAIHRLILISARICCIAQSDTPLVKDLHFLQLIGTYLFLFGFMFVVVERAIATVFTSTYELKCVGYTVPIALYGLVATLSSTSACIVWLQLIEGFDMFFLGIEIATVAVSLLALIAIVMYNKAVYKGRHDLMMSLSDRYQLDENIRASKYLIPVAVNNVLSEVIHIMLMAYSIYFTDIPIGYDTTHLSHAYDLLGAYERLFFVLALIIRSQKFQQFMRRNKPIATSMNSQAVAASNYFNDLKTVWS
ncbi:hypothetical protein Aduo_006591 [Ancylostoma duodenale]